MKNKMKITALMAVLLFTATSVINAQYYMRTNNRMSYVGQCLEIPGLTDTQRTQITAINDAHKTSIDAMRDQFYAAQDISTATDIKTKMTEEQNNHLKKITGVLNETQLKYFNENIVAGPAGGRNYAGGRGNGGFGYSGTAPGRGRNSVVGGTYGRGGGRGAGRANYGRGGGRGAGRGRW